MSDSESALGSDFFDGDDVIEHSVDSDGNLKGDPKAV
jgi:hypothetical protein